MIETYNEAEKIISLALALETSKAIEENAEGLSFTSGIDLKKVRSVKYYVIGEQSKFGALSLITARDEKGDDLGSFIGGTIMLAPCLPE